MGFAALDEGTRTDFFLRKVIVTFAVIFIAAVAVADARVAPSPTMSDAAPAPSVSAAPSPDFAHEFSFGSTPAAGCPRFFLGLRLDVVDSCADRLAEAGWGLSAITYRSGSHTADATDLLAGAFEPHSPKRWVESDESPPSGKSGFLVNVISTSEHLILYYQSGKSRVCNDLLLYRPYDFHVDDERTYFTAQMSERAADGCIPGSYYSLIRRESVQQENADEHVAFVPGDPHTTAAFWPRNDAERKAFEKRAAARGFQRLSLDEIPDRWGKTAGPRYVESIRLGSTPSRYGALEERLRSATEHGEHPVDIRVDSDEPENPKTVRILWERQA
jgi:hypothetical protein